MMRSLWTAASGMSAQQFNVDTIANNMANVNTMGYKKERAEFKSLLYHTIQRASLDEANQTGRPVNLQVGHGVRVAATSRLFTQGSMQSTENPLDFVVQGEGFFMVQYGDDQVSYTRDGSFKLSATDGEYTLVTSDGSPVLTPEGEPVTFSSEYTLQNIAIDRRGNLTASVDNETVDLGVQIGVVQFPNKLGLEAVGDNLFLQTTASGEPLYEADGDTQTISSIIQGYLEMSNVQLAEEMVNLIIAQRAYETNSKAITTSDEMLQTANNLKR